MTSNSNQVSFSEVLEAYDKANPHEWCAEGFPQRNTEFIDNWPAEERHEAALINGCKKFLGLPPYDDWTNMCAGDGFFYQSLVEKYGKEDVEKALKNLCQKR